MSVPLGTTQPQEQEAQKGHRISVAQGSGEGEIAGCSGGVLRALLPARPSVCLWSSVKCVGTLGAGNLGAGLGFGVCWPSDLGQVNPLYCPVVYIK